MSGDLQLVQSCNSGNAAYSHLIGATLEINRSIYFCNKCAGESSQVPHLTPWTKQSPPAIAWSLKISTWPGEEQIQNSCSSGQSSVTTGTSPCWLCPQTLALAAPKLAI